MGHKEGRIAGRGRAVESNLGGKTEQHGQYKILKNCSEEVLGHSMEQQD